MIQRIKFKKLESINIQLLCKYIFKLKLFNGLCNKTLLCYNTSFSFSSASLVLNLFCTSLINRKAVFRFVEGADKAPGSFTFVLR